ncbi:exodeoxyribonuclease V subunit gamma [Vibrio fortis]|uniref:exodeoxyribonuclease V subunit gamma n=1 Tax=Vibrio fortis TaxID=212667 RepID=UPI0040679BA5
MINLYHSNQMELQRQLLIELIKASPVEGVFTPELILVQNPGMSQWLKLSLANDLGIAANIQFPMPSAFIWNTFKSVLKDIPEKSAFTRETMLWLLMDVIPANVDDPVFKPLKSYLEGDEGNAKLHQLCDKIADLFDQYLVFRPEWIIAWENGDFETEASELHPWQPVLWKLLYEHAVNLGHDISHRANLYERFIWTIENGKFNKSNLPERIFVFGVSSLPPRYLDALEVLGKHIDIHLMLTNPCRYFWGDIKDRKYLNKLKNLTRKRIEFINGESSITGTTSPLKEELMELYESDSTLDEAVGNTLLASMGKVGRDYLSMLSEKETQEVELFIDGSRNTLLNCIQDDILNLEDRFFDQDLDSNSHKEIIPKEDRSLTINSCYSPMREVEALQDHLLSLFEDQPDLTPLDIVVMVADIDSYAPYIKAVFGNAPKERYIPFSVSDRTAQTENPILKVFLVLLSIHAERYTSSEVMEVLEVPCVLRKFGIDEGELDTIKLWVEESGIRWGLDKDTACNFSLPEQHKNTWEFGRERMLLGYTLSAEDDEFNGILPYEEVQGSSAELAGKLSLFLEELRGFRKKMSISRPIEDWITVLNEMIDTFFEPDMYEESSVRLIKDKVAALYEQLDDAKYTKEITPIIIFKHFFGQFSKERITQNFMLGKVTFGTLMPMRSIPFKIVALLGMNDGVYPRSVPKDSFDLLTATSRIGDRSRRNDDRYLFLEAMLSAKESLYISYVGKSNKDNTEKTPSVLVSELLEYCQKGYCLEGDSELLAEEAEGKLIENISFEHPLTPFSPAAFIGEKQSFAKEWTKAANNDGKQASEFLDCELDISTMDLTSLDVEELEHFWSFPVRNFFVKRLKVNFNSVGKLADEDEPFKLNGLELYTIKEEWLGKLMEAERNESSHEAVYQDVLHSFELEGALPHGSFAKLALDDIRLEIEEFSANLKDVTVKPLDDYEINLSFDDVLKGESMSIKGWVKGLFKTGIVHYRPGKLRTQDVMTAWLKHLLVNASSETHINTVIVTTDGVWEIQKDTKEQLTSHLKELLKGYVTGQKSPLPFLPRTAMAVCKEARKIDCDPVLKSDEGFDLIKPKINQTFAGGFNFNGERENTYIARVWPELTDDNARDFYLNSISFLYPAMTLLKEVEIEDLLQVNLDIDELLQAYTE